MHTKKGKNFTVEPLGKRKEEVYDIEVEDNHNFFANDLLVHNSVYLGLGDLVDSLFTEEQKENDKWKIVDFLDKACEKKIEPYIDRSYQELADYVNAYQQKMKMSREVIADRGVWTAKKRYILNLYDNEGVRYAEPEQKIMGLEAIRSTTPEIVRGKLKEAYKVILQQTEQDLIRFVEDFRNHWNELSPEDIAMNSSVKGLDKYSHPKQIWVSGTPKHVKGSLIYNNLLKEYSLDKKYPMIQEGEKIKFVNLVKGNKTGANVIAFPGFLPRELGLESVIDYDTQLEKCFLDPLLGVLEAIDWHYESRADLMDFM